MVSKEELIRLVELAWEVASEAKIMAAPMVCGKNEEGHETFSTLRYQTYFHLLDKIVPHAIDGNFTQKDPKEPWQE